MNRQIEIPRFLSHLKVDERGYPIPFFVGYINGKPDFRMLDGVKIGYCISQDLCGVCGKKNTKNNYFFITGPRGLENRIHSDVPIHRACAEYSLHTCPHLFFEKSTRNERGDHYKQAARTTGVAGIKEKPESLFLIRANKWKPVKGPNGGVLFSFRVVEAEEYCYLNGTLLKVEA